MRKKLFNLFALLLMAVTVAWAEDMKTVPLTLEAKTAGTIVVSNPQIGMKYKKNNDDIVTASSTATITINVEANDKVAFYGNGTSITSYYIHDVNNENDTQITGGTAECYIYGNIMSLVNEYEFATATTLTGADAFSGLFSNNAKLYNHATNDLLLPATTLANYCYLGMFSGCTSLTTAPALPATTLADNCYWDMFSGCSKLETAPELPATTLAESCYNSMFRDCTELTTAPELPATTLTDNCYEGMFSGCSKLNSVTCLATNISADMATKGWLYGVAATGTFTKASTMTGWSESENGIPTGWTVANKVILNDNIDIASQLTPGQTCTVEYSREFTADKPSTVCLPFAYAKKTGEQFYTFTGITKDGDDFVATMTLYEDANLVANTPYLYKAASTGVTDFSGTYTLPAEITAGTTVSGDWKFVGTYTTQSWDSAPTGIYGFSAQNANNGITQGEFVKVGAYVRVKPMRCYLMYKNGTEDYHSVRSFSGAPSTLSEPLPERIKVRFIDAYDEVTGIGMLDTQTGEVSFDNEAWYTLDGVRLAEKPTKQGIYIHNGKKVVIK